MCLPVCVFPGAQTQTQTHQGEYGVGCTESSKDCIWGARREKAWKTDACTKKCMSGDDSQWMSRGVSGSKPKWWSLYVGEFFYVWGVCGGGLLWPPLKDCARVLDISKQFKDNFGELE